MGGISGTPAVASTGADRGPAAMAPDFQSTPFSNITVDRMMRGGTVVTWQVEPAFGGALPWNFTLQFGRAGTDDWEQVSNVQNTFQATDSTRRKYSTLVDGYYRVLLSDGGGNTYASAPTSFPENWSERDLRIIDEIRRKELFLYSTRAGMRCWVLYRQRFGADCTACVDTTTGEILDPQCTTCYGTGFIGGYWSPVPTYCLISDTGEEVLEDFGTVIARNMGIRITPIPAVREYDIVILEGSDLRLAVRGTDPVGLYKGHIVIQNLSLEALDPDNVIYDMTWGGSKDPADGQSEIWGTVDVP